MNRKNFLGIVMIIIIITSGPIFYTLVQAVNNTIENDNLSNQTSYYSTNGTILIPEIKPSYDTDVRVSIIASKSGGESPLPIKLKCLTQNEGKADGILLYIWDFDGDGFSDRVTYDENEVIHVFETTKSKLYNVTVTVGFVDGTYKSASTKISIDSTDISNWEEIKEIGNSKLGILKNGTIIVFNENSWLSTTFKVSNAKLRNHNYTHSLDTRSRILSYPLDNGRLEVNLSYGISGKAELSLEEFNDEGILVPPMERSYEIPEERTSGNLKFRYRWE